MLLNKYLNDTNHVQSDWDCFTSRGSRVGDHSHFERWHTKNFRYFFKTISISLKDCFNLCLTIHPLLISFSFYFINKIITFDFSVFKIRSQVLQYLRRSLNIIEHHQHTSVFLFANIEYETTRYIFFQIIKK